MLGHVTFDDAALGVYRISALLLDYPGEDWDDIIDTVDQWCVGHGSAATGGRETICPAARELAAFVEWARCVGRRGVECAYVETFDQRRRCCLELSYYLTGDTRQRGIALSIFRDLYRAVGWEIADEVLPDYLPSVLELAWRSTGEDRALVEGVIAAHREGIETLALALARLESPWAHVLDALRHVLPDVDEATMEHVRHLIRTGPPSEMVGVDSALTPNNPVPAMVTGRLADVLSVSEMNMTGKVNLR